MGITIIVLMVIIALLIIFRPKPVIDNRLQSEAFWRGYNKGTEQVDSLVLSNAKEISNRDTIIDSLYQVIKKEKQIYNLSVIELKSKNKEELRIAREKYVANTNDSIEDFNIAKLGMNLDKCNSNNENLKYIIVQMKVKETKYIETNNALLKERTVDKKLINDLRKLNEATVSACSKKLFWIKLGAALIIIGETVFVVFVSIK